MTFIPAPNTAKVEMRFSQEGQQIENVYHVTQAAPFDATELNTLAASFKAWWVAQWQTSVVNTCSLVQIVATALDSASAPGIVYATGLPLVGGNAGFPSPLNVTVAIQWFTALRGRSYRGRTYHIGLTANDRSGSYVSTTFQTNAIARYQALITAMNSYAPGLVVVSYRGNNAPRGTALTTEIVTAACELTLDSQRRRLPGRGA